MKNANTLSQSGKTLRRGWAIDAYDSNQHLLFTLKPSYSWVMLASAIVGLAMAVLGFTLVSSYSAAPPTGETATITAPLQVD